MKNAQMINERMTNEQMANEQVTNEQMSNEIDALYRQGKEHLAAQRYADALAAFRQARAMYAGHYKDTDQLIVEAQTKMQKQKWQARQRS
jgi:outer membrane protein assembly factor BamD (BamD/ComL family)